MKFIRVKGRVVPVKDKGSESKRYGSKREVPAPKKLGSKKGASAGAAIGALAGALKKRAYAPNVQLKSGLAGAVVGALAGAAIGSIKVYKKGKGESDKQLAKRASGSSVSSKLPKKYT